MKALLSRRCGGPEALEYSEVATPEVGDSEVRITVRACAINYPDVLMIEDKYQFKPERPFAPGVEIAGVVESVGPKVTSLQAGNRVLASLRWGGLAEFAVAHEDHFTVIPDSMPFNEAAAFQVTYGTGYHALVDRGNLASGETLLVMGASGGVGLAAVELGRAFGAHVVAAVSSESKGAYAKERGAHDVIVYPTHPEHPRDLGALFKGCAPSGIDVIYDPIGGAYSEPALRSLNFGGRHLVIGFAAGIPSPPWNIALLKGSAIVGVFWGAWMSKYPLLHRRNNEALLRMYSLGELRPLVSETFPLREGGAAIRRLAERKAIGKLVVTV